MGSLSENLRGAILMVVAMCAYTFNDAFMKSVAGELPLFQAVFLRGIGAVSCLGAMCWVMGHFRAKLSVRDWRMMILRAVGEVGGTYFFLTALFNMPIANVTAILQALPLAVALAAALVLTEPLGWRRLLAIAVGFAGVMLIVQPGGADFTVYSLYALAAVGCITVRDIAVRRMSPDVPTVFVALMAAIGVMCLGAVGSLFVDWRPMTMQSSGAIVGAIMCLSLGYIVSVSAMRFGDISFVAPFRYTGLLVALVIGVIVFDEWPNAWALLGAAVVVGTGLFTLYRESCIKARHRMVPDRIR